MSNDIRNDRVVLNDEYTEYTDWINFDKFESWLYFLGYAYEYDKSDIELVINMLSDNHIRNIVEKEIHVDWEDANLLMETKIIPEYLKHAIRIAMIVIRINEGHDIIPVRIDTFSHSFSKLEGHHRLLALKFLNYNTFPVFLSGMIDELDLLI